MKIGVRLLLFFAIFIFSRSNAQLNSYIGLESSLTNDFITLQESGNKLEECVLLSGMYGVNFTKEISKTASIQTGVLLKIYNDGIRFENTNFIFGDVFSSMLVPLRFTKTIHKPSMNSQFKGLFGYVFCMNMHYEYGVAGMGTGMISPYRSSNISSVIDPTLVKYYSLLQFGILYDIEFCKYFLFETGVNYYQGTEKVVETEYVYSINGNEYKGSSFSRSSFLGLSFSLKYKIHTSKRRD